MAMRKVALVTGSSRGIGKGIAAELVHEGYTVYVSGRDEATVADTVRGLKGAGVAKPFVANLLLPGVPALAISQIMNTEGQLDVLVSNLGSGQSTIGWNIPIEEYRRVFDLNFFSSVEVCTKAADVMQPGSNIVVISSIAGCESIGAPIAYAAAKTALLSFVKTFSTQVASKKIRVNAISPGNVMVEGGTWDSKLKQNRAVVDQYIEKNVPLNGFASPNDIAKAVAFLIGARFVTGHNLIVDGGQVHKII